MYSFWHFFQEKCNTTISHFVKKKKKSDFYSFCKSESFLYTWKVYMIKWWNKYESKYLIFRSCWIWSKYCGTFSRWDFEWKGIYRTWRQGVRINHQMRQQLFFSLYFWWKSGFYQKGDWFFLSIWSVFY